MRYELIKSILRTAAIATAAIVASGAASAQTVVNLTAARMTATLPDGNLVPMWGYCATPASGTCGTGWAPAPTIVVPTDATGFGSLTINLTNTLPTPTSIVILGQLGGGLGSGGTTGDVPRVQFPQHAASQPITWPAIDPTAGFSPPAQGARARAFAPEAAASTGTQTYTWAKLRPGTYLYETGSVPSLQAPMGLYGVLVVTQAPAATTPGDAYPVGDATVARVPYDADTTLLFSEIDPRQNAAVDAAAVANADVTMLFSDLNCTAATPCYPPAVNYAPTYFLINGQAFDPSQPAKSGFALSDNKVLTTSGGQMLVRLVNAGLRTHVPSIVGLPSPLRIVAEDGFVAPGRAKAQSQVLMAAGKTMDVVFTPLYVSGLSTYANVTYPVFDRALSLTSSNLATQSAMANSGMLGFIALQPAGAVVGSTTGDPATSGAAIPLGLTAKANNDAFAAPVATATTGNVLKNDVNVVTAALGTGPAHGAVSLNSDGSFTYTPTAGYTGSDSFTYVGNGNSAVTATVTVNVGATVGNPTANADTFASKVATLYKSSGPGVLGNDTDPGKLALTAVLDAVGTCGSVTLSTDGGFVATPKPAGTACTFKYHAQNSQGGVSTTANATVTFKAGSGLAVTVQDTQDQAITLADYSWVIEEDTTYFHDPKAPAASNTLATNFHKSYMPVVASGCTGFNSCGDGNSGSQFTKRTRALPSDVVLDPTKRYYISVLPGDADQGDAAYNPDGTVAVAAFGHTMGGVSIAPGQLLATVLVPRNALPPAQLSVVVFEDNNPTNGGVDANEPGLGGFTINLYDTRGSSGDPAGLMTYDLSGMPFTNSLANKLDSVTGVNLCPMTGPSGTIITCPEKDGAGNTSSLAGMALIKNINPGRYDVWATPGADRAVKGETWVQVSTLEGTHANDTFIKPGEKAYWQEFGPPGFHSFIGFVNPDHVKAVNAVQAGTATVNGRIPSLHMDRPTPLMANLNNSCATGTNADGSPINPSDPSCRATLNSTTCYVGVNSVGGTGANVALATCDQFGNFSIKNVPAGSHSLVVWDQWLDQIIAYKALTVPATPAVVVNTGDIPVFSWFTRVEQSAFVDLNQNGVRDPGEPGVSQIPMNIRFRDGSISNFLATDSTGSVTANELFPLFNWYVLESDTTRYTGTGVNVTYDSGGKPDAALSSVTDLHGNTVVKDFRGVLNSTETVSLPAALQVPGAQYTAGKTSRVDPGTTLTEGTQGFINQTAAIDWGKRPYVPGENGGITGLVYYASTRGFDDPSLEVQFSWEPAVPRVPVNLYQEVKNADGSVSRILVDHTTTWSWDDAAAALRCPGDPVGDPMLTTLGYDSTKAATDPANLAVQFKCYDGQHNFNQVQPTVYDGRYRFPTKDCTICTANPANNLPGKPASVTYPKVLPKGMYVVELVVPEGYEIVKEEDKNILIGDAWIAPSETTQFMGVGNIFIVPDQATLNDANVIGSNITNAFPACVGALHRVPDYLSLFPGNQQVAPYAGQDRPLCDHKEVALDDQSQGGADFQVFTQTPIAGHISGIMLNDAAAEFDPYNPAFLEKASLPNAPVSVRDYNGVEIARVYNDKWGTFNNLVPSTWQANVPNPSGYGPNMLTYCMNDPGPIADPLGGLDPATGRVRMVVDPTYNPMFSNFCYVWPAMPGITTYLDTPVLPVAAYASGSSYEPVDCAYPANTPAIYRVDGTETGPYIDLAVGSQLRISSLGDVQVPNPAYEGPLATAPATAMLPKITRHYGFGAARGTVKIGNSTLSSQNVVSWSDTSIVVNIPSNVATGELSITTAQGVQSVDTITVTIAPAVKPAGYRAPVHVSPPVAGLSGADTLLHPIQDAIDAAFPGDMIILDAGNYSELVIMDRPVRLQGVGAAAVVINAAKYPNQKIDAWRTRINRLFGLDNQGNTLPGTPQVDPLPGQEITGGIVLLEPSVLATEEGAGITVVAKGYQADGITPLTASVLDCGFKGNFRCAPSRIDGLSVTGSDAGGGIYVNGWAHNLEISNNRVFGNAGPLSGGVRVGQPYLAGQALAAGAFTGFKYDQNVNIHHNAITNNGTVEGNPAAGAVAAAAGGAGGGVSICSGSDGYKLTGNWICGNYSSSDGGGVGHIGLSNNGTISNNKILFNESFNQTGIQNGGGLVIEGEGGTGTTLTLGTGNVTVDANLIQGNFARAGSGGGVRLASVNGVDAVDNRQRWKVTLTNNIITNNLAAYAGAGVSLADTLFSSVVNNTIAMNDSTGIAGNLFNTQVGAANTGPTTAVPNPAGVSSELTSAPLLNSLPVASRNTNAISNPTLVNNIIWHNRSFFFTINAGTSQLSPSNDWADAVAANKPAPLGVPAAADNGCVPSQEKYWDLGVVGDTSTLVATPATLVRNVLSASQVGAGSVASPYLATITTTVAHGIPNGAVVVMAGVTGPTGANRGRYNGSFVVSVTGADTFTYQPSGGGVGAATFATLNFAAATVTYTPPNTVMAAGNSVMSTNATAAQLALVKTYCNASRTLPGLQFEPGTPFQPAFNISVAATLDESGNFVDLHFGPLSVMDQATGTTINGNYRLAGTNSLAYNTGSGANTGAPNHDYDGQERPQGGAYDKGADEFVAAAAPVVSVTGGPLSFGNVVTGSTSAAQTLSLSNTGAATLNSIALTFNGTGFSRPVGGNGAAGTCGSSLAAGQTCTINVVFSPSAAGAAAATLAISGNVVVSGSPVSLSGTGVAAVVSASLTPASWSPTQTRNCPGVTALQRLACATDPVQVFTLTNTGNAPLTGIAGLALAGVNTADYTIARLLTTCGPASGNQLVSTTILAPGATCAVAVQFRPLTSEAVEVKSATISVTDSAGTQASTLSGAAQ